MRSAISFRIIGSLDFLGTGMIFMDKLIFFLTIKGLKRTA